MLDQVSASINEQREELRDFGARLVEIGSDLQKQLDGYDPARLNLLCYELRNAVGTIECVRRLLQSRSW